MFANSRGRRSFLDLSSPGCRVLSYQDRKMMQCRWETPAVLPLNPPWNSLRTCVRFIKAGRWLGRFWRGHGVSSGAVLSQDEKICRVWDLFILGPHLETTASIQISIPCLNECVDHIGPLTKVPHLSYLINPSNIFVDHIWPSWSARTPCYCRSLPYQFQLEAWRCWVVSLQRYWITHLGTLAQIRLQLRWSDHNNYPLVNVCITMEESPFLMGKSTISMAMFNSYVKLPEGIIQATVKEVHLMSTNLDHPDQCHMICYMICYHPCHHQISITNNVMVDKIDTIIRMIVNIGSNSWDDGWQSVWKVSFITYSWQPTEKRENSG